MFLCSKLRLFLEKLSSVLNNFIKTRIVVLLFYPAQDNFSQQVQNCSNINYCKSMFLVYLGLDFEAAMEIAPKLAEHQDVARKAKVLADAIKPFQNSVTSLELCHKPVLAAVHSACVGAGVDYISAADVRYCTKDAWFQVKEV